MLNRHLRREAHAEGITAGQAALLAQIRNHPELGVRDLAAREGISAPVMTRASTGREGRADRALALRREDGRRIRLALTPKGVRVLRSVRRRRTAWLAERLEGLSPAELRAVDEAIEPLLRLVGGRVTARPPRPELAHVREPPAPPELPPVLHRPARLGDRHVDAGHGAALAHPLADALAGVRRRARLRAIRAVHDLRALLGRARRPVRQPPGRDGHAGELDGGRRRARRARVRRRRRRVAVLRARVLRRRGARLRRAEPPRA